MTDTKTKALGSLLRERRLELNLTQREVAQRLEIGEVRYGDYERGVHEPSASRLLDILRVLSLPSPFDEVRDTSKDVAARVTLNRRRSQSRPATLALATI